ncbi:MAG: hypothetical protein JWP86_3189 [Phenylobacterium sp.]|nr:hypothetical protein [Phenylobacterium sp.]
MQSPDSCGRQCKGLPVQSSGATAVHPEAGATEPVAAAPAPRIVYAGLEASLERFSDRTLLAAGKVNLISLDAVRERFGKRWSLRQDQVYSFAERVLQRGLGPRGLYLRASGTDFLIVQPDQSRLAGQAACLRYLREILLHFLGDTHLAYGGVLQVTRIAPGAIDAKQVDMRAAELAEAKAAEEGAAAELAIGDLAAGGAAAEPAARRSVDQWSPFVSVDGRQLRVSATLEPVYELKGFTRIGFRLIRRVIVIRTREELSVTSVAELSASDLLRVDLATIARGMDRVEADGEGEKQLSLIIPLSYASLASHRGRAELVQPLREADRHVTCGVICEICDIEGVPSGGLLSAVSLIKPFTLLVVGHLIHPSVQTLSRLKGAGLRALSLECPRGLSDAEFSAWAVRTLRPAKRVAGSVMVYGVESARRAGELSLVGATHVSLASA